MLAIGVRSFSPWLRLAAYGTSGLFVEPADNRSHGLNERILVQSLYDGQEYLYRLVKRLAAKP